VGRGFGEAVYRRWSNFGLGRRINSSIFLLSAELFIITVPVLLLISNYHIRRNSLGKQYVPRTFTIGCDLLLSGLSAVFQ
jgi:hypothetical protein